MLVKSEWTHESLSIQNRRGAKFSICLWQTSKPVRQYNGNCQTADKILLRIIFCKTCLSFKDQNCENYPKKHVKVTKVWKSRCIIQQEAHCHGSCCSVKRQRKGTKKVLECCMSSCNPLRINALKMLVKFECAHMNAYQSRRGAKLSNKYALGSCTSN